jgi:hypothetical protein
VGDGPQLLNLYTWIREPVEPASIMSAYCTSGEDGLCGAVQKTVLLGSGSDSYELGRGAEGSGRDGAGTAASSISGLCGSIMGGEGGRGGDSASTGPFHPASPQSSACIVDIQDSPGALVPSQTFFGSVGLKNHTNATTRARQRAILLHVKLRNPTRLGPMPLSSLS